MTKPLWTTNIDGWHTARVIRTGQLRTVRLSVVVGDERWHYAFVSSNNTTTKVGMLLKIPPTLTLKVRMGERVHVQVKGRTIVAIGRR